MDIKVNTDSHITGSDEFAERYSEKLARKLKHFDELIMSADIFFADENKGKPGADDKRCTIEVRIRNRKNEAVTHFADTLEHAFSGAVEKMKNLLESLTGKLQEHPDY
jgi:ribosome-associated translation inhibitor RaiA